MLGMPGTNLTREEAATRAALLDVTSYSIDLDLTTGDKIFASTTTVRFSCREPGAESFAKCIGVDLYGGREGVHFVLHVLAQPRDGAELHAVGHLM